MKVTLEGAKKRFPQLIKTAEKGEIVTICRGGNPVVDMVRTLTPPESKARSKGKRRFGTLRGKIVVVDPKW